MSRTIIRQKIITDCAALFNQKGYLHIGIPEIEKATGQTKAVLYGYFENKYALAKAVMAHNLSRHSELLQQYTALQGDCLHKLLAHIEIYDPGKKLFPGGCPILNAAIEVNDIDDDMRQMVAKALLEWRQDIATIISTGIQNKEFNASLNPDQLAWLLISLIDGAVFISHTTQNTKLNRQLLEQAKTIFLKQLTVNLSH